MLSAFTKAAETQRHLGRPYIDFLEFIHRTLEPTSYFEVGTSTGTSLEVARCPTVCVDPSFQIGSNVFVGRSLTFMFQMGSDQFFRQHDLKTYFPNGPDFSFLDGMHRLEYLLRDFINTERLSHKQSLIALHDCLPLNRRMAERTVILGEEGDPYRDAWTGDVWKLIPILKQYRPDLRIIFVDSPPTGLVLVSNLSPDSSILSDNYYKIIDEFIGLELDRFGLSKLFKEYPVLDSTKVMENPHMLTALLSLF